MSAPFDSEMYVVKRDGQREIVSFDKILKRIKTLGQEVGIQINYTTLVIKVIDQLYDGISTTKIDELMAAQCASLASTHPDYNILAGRIAVSSHQKNTSSSFLDVMTRLYNYTDKHGSQSPLVTKDFMAHVLLNADAIEAAIDYSRDYLIDYFGFKTLERAYLMSVNREIVERPQHMWMRVAIGIHGANIDRVKETYDLMSQKYFTHATPTLFNAGTPHPQLSSCFLLAMENDSIDGIYSTLRDCALISKWAGGIGLHVHNVRAKGSHIRGTNGSSNGIVPMLRVFNNTAKYVDQCVHPETMVYTTRGPKQIQHCVAGETAILNRLGEPEVVQAALDHAYEGETLTIKTASATPLRITPEHPVYVLRDASKYTAASLQSALEKQHIQFEWMEAKEINTDDYIVHAIPRYEADDHRLSPETCAIYGVMMDCLIDLASEPEFTLKPRPSQREKLTEYFESNSIQYKVVGDNTLIIVEKSPSFPFKTTDFFSETGEARIHPKWLNLPLEKIKVIRDALSKRGDRLQYDLEYLELRLYAASENFTWYKDGLGAIYHHEDYVLYPVLSVETGFYEGLVYDLQMTKQHNYQLHSGLVHNGGGKRNGSFAIYLEPWHADIEAFLQMRKNHGDEELKARDLFYALWIPDLFMERVKTDGGWTLMCPDECPGLAEVYGDEFVALYTRYETEGKGRQTIKARALWFQMLDAQMETGTPYILYKDACNRKSNQQNLGTIKSSNLCSEVVQYSDENESAVCNLASIALPTFVKSIGGDLAQNAAAFDFEKLHQVARTVTYNLNRVIDVNYYPTEKTRRSNVRHRPIGIGIQGLADVFMVLGLPFASEEARDLNRQIFETIYHAAVEESCALARVEGAYETFVGSPASQGKLQFDLWNIDPGQTRYDWATLKSDVMKYGMRNSLLVAPMPTASTSQILGFNECIEPITSNIYSRRTLAGEFILANKYLMNDLIQLDLWNDKIKNNIIANHGSIQQIDSIPQNIKDLYKTVWEIPMRALIDMAADRGAYVCQSQSLNLWLEDPNYNSLTSMHFYSWSKGLKTGIYYLRRRARHQAQQFTIEPEKVDVSANLEEDEICEMCSA
jgi:ribonucleoside-diphosphate reductase alpha subunit